MLRHDNVPWQGWQAGMGLDGGEGLHGLDPSLLRPRQHLDLVHYAPERQPLEFRGLETPVNLGLHADFAGLEGNMSHINMVRYFEEVQAQLFSSSQRLKASYSNNSTALETSDGLQTDSLDGEEEGDGFISLQSLAASGKSSPYPNFGEEDRCGEPSPMNLGLMPPTREPTPIHIGCLSGMWPGRSQYEQEEVIEVAVAPPPPLPPMPPSRMLRSVREAQAAAAPFAIPAGFGVGQALQQQVPPPPAVYGSPVQGAKREPEVLPPPRSTVSRGSVGHPERCNRACKYAWRSRGCKDGENCVRCHLCRWRRATERQVPSEREN